MMQHLLQSPLRRVRHLVGLAVLCAFLAPGAASAQFVTMESGFNVTDLGSSVGAKGIECSPGGVWGDYIYVADSGGNIIERIDFSDVVTTFATLPVGSFPVGMAFGPGPGANFGDYIYVACYGTSMVHRVDPSGTVTPFSAAVASPGDCNFDPSGAYGNDLLITTAYSGPIYKMDEFGVAVPWAAFQSLYMRFGPGGAWGTGMYATSQTAVGIVKVDMAGTPTNFCTGFTGPEGFEWADGIGFDGDMFAPDVSTGEVWRVKSDGTRTLFATMPGAADLTFCNGALYVVGFHGGCYKITYDNPVAVAFKSLDARALRGAVELSWDIATDEEIRGFNVYRESGNASTMVAIAGSDRVGPAERDFRDDAVEPGATYRYEVGVVTASGNELRSAPTTVTLAGASLVMAQNYPNPFNPTTTISYSLPEAADIAISVYDSQGRRVVELESGVRSAGDHEVSWDGRDAHGDAVASGIYFYRLTANNNTLTRKLVLLK